MAQAGYTPISLYYSTTSTQEPTAGNLVSGELAINIADGKLFYKNSAGDVRLLSIGYGSSSVTPTNGGVQYGTGTALALTAAGSSGQILRSNGTAAPTWADLSTLGVNTISFGTTGLTPNSATAGAVTVAGTLVTANGGTGLGGATPFTANGVLYASSASALTSGSALTFDGTNFATTGTASATKFIPTGGTATGNGMYLPTSNELAWSNNGSETMRLTSTGLGIGTSSPGYKLDVVGPVNLQGTSTFPVTGMMLRSADNQLKILGGSAGIAFAAASGASTYATIDSSGNLGIGTSLPGAKLDVNGEVRALFSSGFTLYNAGSQISKLYYNGGLILDRAAGTNLYFTLNGSNQATLDASGNLGLGVTPSGFTSNPAFCFGTSAKGSLSYAGGAVSLGDNFYRPGSGYNYTTTAAATLYQQTGGVHYWFNAPSGTAGNAISFTQALTLDASGNLLLNGTSAPASSAGNLVMFNGTAPTGNVTNGCTLFCEDVSSSSELKVRDEAGNVTTLSPHNFSLIPQGPSEDMAWSYYSERDGKRINIDMLKAIRVLEKLSGEQLVYEA